MTMHHICQVCGIGALVSGRGFRKDEVRCARFEIGYGFTSYKHKKSLSIPVCYNCRDKMLAGDKELLDNFREVVKERIASRIEGDAFRDFIQKRVLTELEIGMNKFFKENFHPDDKPTPTFKMGPVEIKPMDSSGIDNSLLFQTFKKKDKEPEDG